MFKNGERDYCKIYKQVKGTGLTCGCKSQVIMEKEKLKFTRKRFTPIPNGKLLKK
jgi:hypothetical protein